MQLDGDISIWMFSVSHWIYITIKVPVHAFSYLHICRKHVCSAKPRNSEKMKPKIHKALLKIVHFCPLLYEKLYKICRVLAFITEHFHTFYLKSVFLFFIFLFFPYFLRLRLNCCQAIHRKTILFQNEDTEQRDKIEVSACFPDAYFVCTYIVMLVLY